MGNKRRAVAILTLLVMVGLMAAVAMAQDKPGETYTMQAVLDAIRSNKKLLVMNNLDLSESEAKAFWPVYEQYQNELFLLRARTIKLLEDYANAYEKMTDESAKKLLDEYMAIEALQLKLRQTYLPKIRKVLPPVKTARYYQIENKIQAALYYELAQSIPLVKTAE